MDMHAPMMQNVRQKNDPLVGFHGQHVHDYKKGDATKEANEVIHNALFASWLERYILV
jgi:hypothetical protein